MRETDSFLYAAFKAKDTRFDGRFFVGIASTKIYCRPVCRAKLARPENCRFFSSAAEAEQAGYRPCLLCRPECAPGCSAADASTALARKAARLLEESCAQGQSFAVLAAKLGCSDRHLRRVFTEEFRVSPVRYLQTCRLLLAKNLLTDTNLSVLDVAMAAGFGSLRRLNELFRTRYGLVPTALRKKTTRERKAAGGLTIVVGYRPPYRWEELFTFLADRAISGVERVENGRYLRVVRLNGRNGVVSRGWLAVGHQPQKNVLTVTLSDSLISVLPQIVARVRRLFDLDCDPAAVYETLRTMDKFRPGVCAAGVRVPGCFDPFETAVRAVLGQQISVKAANVLAGRIAKKYGEPLETGVAGLTHAFPTAADVLALGNGIEEAWGALGVTTSRSRCILALAAALESGAVTLGGSADPQREIEKLMRISGIGRWTANVIAMRTMGWPDAFFETDAALRRALPSFTVRELAQVAEEWRPWRSYAAMNLWNSQRATCGEKEEIE